MSHGDRTSAHDETLALEAIQLLLSEKRTALSVMRTGIAVFALPLGVLSLLVATSRYYSIGSVLHLFLPLLALCTGLVILGSYLVIHSIRRIRRYDRRIRALRERSGVLGPLVD